MSIQRLDGSCWVLNRNRSTEAAGEVFKMPMMLHHLLLTNWTGNRSFAEQNEMTRTFNCRTLSRLAAKIVEMAKFLGASGINFIDSLVLGYLLYLMQYIVSYNLQRLCRILFRINTYNPSTDLAECHYHNCWITELSRSPRRPLDSSSLGIGGCNPAIYQNGINNRTNSVLHATDSA